MSDVTVFSTTDSQEQVDAAANYDVEIGHNESLPDDERSSTTITSTTDSATEVEQARYGDRDDEPHARDGRFTQQATEKPLPIQSTTDPEEVVREESAKLPEHQETTGIDYATGRPRGAEKRIAKLTREKMEARAEAEALRARSTPNISRNNHNSSSRSPTRGNRLSSGVTPQRNSSRCLTH